VQQHHAAIDFLIPTPVRNMWRHQDLCKPLSVGGEIQLWQWKMSRNVSLSVLQKGKPQHGLLKILSHIMNINHNIYTI
jgi:hypothetical protein